MHEERPVVVIEDIAEFVGRIILEHECHSEDCPCWKLRDRPEIREAMRKIGDPPVEGTDVA